MPTDYRLPPRRGTTKVQESEFYAGITDPSGSHQTLTSYSPGSGTLAAAGRGYEYRVQRMHVSLSASAAVTITDGTNTLWGPHTLPAGFGDISFLDHDDPSRGGLRCGHNTQPAITGTFTGEIALMGFKVPATET